MGSPQNLGRGEQAVRMEKCRASPFSCNISARRSTERAELFAKFQRRPSMGVHADSLGEPMGQLHSDLAYTCRLVKPLPLPRHPTGRLALTVPTKITRRIPAWDTLSVAARLYNSSSIGMRGNASQGGVAASSDPQGDRGTNCPAAAHHGPAILVNSRLALKRFGQSR